MGPARLGIVERLGGDPAAGLRAQEESFALVHEGPRAPWNRVRALVEIGLDQADLWRAFNPESRWAGEAALWLGRCYTALGRGGEARAALTRAAPLLARSPLSGDQPLARAALSGT